MTPDQDKGFRFQPKETYPHAMASKALNMAANIDGRHTLPHRVFVATREAGEIWGIELKLERHLDGMGATVDVGWIGQLAHNATITDVADELLQGGNPQGKSLVCDRQLSGELGEKSLTYVDEDHYRLEGRRGGVLEVFVPYASEEKQLSPEISLELYTE